MRGLIYDATILPLTSKWYAAVLGRLAPGSRLLDVGIGTGSALLSNAPLLRERDLTVVGVDIDADYIQRATGRIATAGVGDRVTVRLESVYDHQDGPYDAVYFSASFMLMPDPPAALEHVCGLLSPGGRVFFTQTFQERRSRVLEKAKPLLGKLTTIEFGRVTYEGDFRDTVAAGGVDLLELTTMSRRGTRTFRLAIGAPKTL